MLSNPEGIDVHLVHLYCCVDSRISYLPPSFPLPGCLCYNISRTKCPKGQDENYLRNLFAECQGASMNQ